VTVLVHARDLEARGQAASGPLRALADSLARDLEPVLARELFVPREKARMTRRGGRCEVDGTMLEFDPFSPRSHRCPRCGRVFDDDSHYRWWIMGYQLWLAERAVHAAALFALRGDARYRAFTAAVLDAHAEQYLHYPNKDNVLGPTRVFFSTYLESIWLLQLIVALDLLELAGGTSAIGALGGRARERIIEPSAALIAEYDEGLSNRQVWNNAALLAASRILRGTLDESAVRGRSGLLSHLTSGLLADGTWYEGENYHLFAHRGLWYGVTIVEAAGGSLERSLVTRFDEAFATPFVTALPDFTFPARRDSQYAVSLRQWRFAEVAELGLVRQPRDERLLGALATLYDGSVPRHDTGRERSTAEAERNTPATALGRADLGWRSLLFALPALPPLTGAPPRSALLSEQGYAILRRERGQLYAALDYGHSGAGHGHPDRLNFVLVHGRDRWLDDVGTGSYVDPSLHWYRSTLAHNAPLVNGRSQERVHGALVAFDERGDVGWVKARVDEAAAGVRLARAIVATPTYVIDELSWDADREIELDLPVHADGEVAGVGPWRPADPEGGTGIEDGFRFLTDAETAPSGASVRLRARLGAAVADAHVSVNVPHAWWRATAVGAPGSGPARFHFVRARAERGRIVSVWDVLGGAIESVTTGDRTVRVTLGDGLVHEHASSDAQWRITTRSTRILHVVALSGGVDAKPGHVPSAAAPQQRLVIPRVTTAAPARALEFELGEQHYRRSEPAWMDAGSPSATISLSVENDELVVVADVRKQELHFAPPTPDNLLDNEPPDTNSDGIQLHVILPPAEENGQRAPRAVTWLMVPEGDTDRVRVTAHAIGGPVPPLRAAWRRTLTGYVMRCTIPVDALISDPLLPIRLGVVVNDMAPDRERRRGQLVLGGGPGEFVYLRGDRLSADAHLEFVIADA